MVRLYLLIKKKGSKRFLGAIPVKKGVTINKLKKTIPKQLRRGLIARIVTSSQLKKVISRMSPRTMIRKRLRRKKR